MNIDKIHNKKKTREILMVTIIHPEPLTDNAWGLPNNTPYRTVA